MRNWGSGVTIAALGGNDTIESRGSDVSINAGAGNDSAEVSGNRATIKDCKIARLKDCKYWQSGNPAISQSMSGNDVVSLSGYYNYNTIDGGAGNDTIISKGDNQSIIGGSGDDVINVDLVVSG